MMRALRIKLHSAVLESKSLLGGGVAGGEERGIADNWE